MWMVDSHERLARSVDELRYRTLRVVGDHAQIESGGVHRPGVDLGEAMAGRELHRVVDARVVLDLDARVAPPIKTVAHVVSVVQGDVLLEDVAARTQLQFDAPLHAIGAINVTHPDGCAAVGIL